MLDLLLFCASVAVGFYLFYWYRSDLARAAESIQDSFQSHGDLMRAIRRCGLRRLRTVLGVDFSASNEWQGNRTFGHQCLHRVVALKPSNPYQRAIQAVGRALEPLLDGGDVFAYGFGDATSRDAGVFPLRPDGRACVGFRDALSSYSAAARGRVLAGPTSLRPLIERAVQHARQLPAADDTIAALVDASAHPLSVVLVGVGDGPWDTMEALDDFVPARRFDNFQFVDFNQACAPGGGGELVFAMHLLMEVPEHFRLLFESSPTRIIAGDPTPRLRRKVMSLR
ncbi:E3 ubiquitin-protein ligase RGLG1-like [Pollicipes pollicipes]|uniref:E3 ubiquitin-protein ligase RGLG1-like n=1 Tax=Pollicipes pollicipes TaxID=41117 RepID=UPI001884F0C1|nr:E3 ubiquitin-protein ligase RGLG1-like [Pollicipes pollicipes]